MSSAPTEDSIEQSKREIRALVVDIAELSKTKATADEYYPIVLERLLQALHGVGGIVWLREGNSLRPAYHNKVEPGLIDQPGEESQRHNRLLGHALEQSKTELVPPHADWPSDGEAGNPTRYLLMLTPMILETHTFGLIEIFQRAETSPEAQRGYVYFINSVVTLIADWYKGHQFDAANGRQQLWQEADEFARLVHNSLDLNDTAYTIANEARRLIGCDRVSVANMRGRKAKVIAISGQDTIESRSNIVQALNKLATRVVRAGEPLWYDGNTEDLPPQIEETIEDYVDLSHGRSVAVLPILQPEKTVQGDVLAKRDAIAATPKRGKIIGALIVEQIETQLSPEELKGRVDLAYEHACRAMSNSRTHSSLFLMPLWRTLDRATWLFRGSALPKTLGVLTLLGLAIAALCSIKIDFDLEAKGSLMPQMESKIFAHVDGEVKEVFVHEGDLVAPGQPIVLLKNPDLEARIEEIRGQRNLTLSQLRSIEYSQNISGLSEVERRRLDAEKAENQEQQKNLARQLQILEAREKQLVRTSPIEGTVITWDVEKVLRARPVVTGQLLVTVADFKQPWELEVLMPEKRMKHLDLAFEQADKAGNDFLTCEFIQKSDPQSIKHTGKLFARGVHQQAEINGDEGTAVRLRIVPDSMDGISKLPGSQVTVDVKCGTASAGYAWFHEVPEWIRANLLF